MPCSGIVTRREHGAHQQNKPYGSIVAWGEVPVTKVVVRLQLPQLTETRPGRSPVTRSTEGLCRAGLQGYRAGM